MTEREYTAAYLRKIEVDQMDMLRDRDVITNSLANFYRGTHDPFKPFEFEKKKAKPIAETKEDAAAMFAAFGGKVVF